MSKIDNNKEAMSDSLHAFQFGQETKQQGAVLNLHEALIPFGKAFSLKAGCKMLLSSEKKTAFILLVTKGCFSFSHLSSDLCIATVFAPTIVGLIDGYSLYYDVSKRPQHYIRAETNCIGWIIPINLFVNKCDEMNLWHDVAKILAQRMMVLLTRDNELTGNDAYSKIRTLLIELWSYPEEIRRQIKITPFIQRRTKMSRSRVMNILSELKKGNHIETEMGILLSLSHLPKLF